MWSKKRLLFGSFVAILIAAGAFSLFRCDAVCAADIMREQNRNFSHIDAASFKEQLPGGSIIDVRTPEEYVAGHIAGAMLIDIYGKDFEARVGQLDKEIPYYVYCRSGNRSQNALTAMETAGFREVYGLEGGMGAWEDAGFPLE